MKKLLILFFQIFVFLTAKEGFLSIQLFLVHIQIHLFAEQVMTTTS